MAERLTPDLCVIGAGSGGLSVAAAAAMMGVPVVLVERGKMGGDCLNVGCVPSKALIAAGHHAASARVAKHFGVIVGDPRIDFARVHDHVQGVIKAIEPNDSEERFRALGVTVIKGEAAFVDRRMVKVGETEIRARRFVIATGSVPAVPEIPGLSDIRYLTNETIFDLEERPAKLLILGAGPIGMELAQAFRRLGSEVAILSHGEVMSREDREAADITATALEREGVVIHRHAHVSEAAKRGEKIALTFLRKDPSGLPETQLSETGTHLLISTGRKVQTGSLALEAAGVSRNDRGIIVDKKLRTSNKRIYAIGDCAGGPQFTHAANYHAGLVIRHALFRQPVAVDYFVLPRVTYTDPEIASVGMNEAEARTADRSLAILRWPFSENDRAIAEQSAQGFVKVLAGRKGRILGVTIVGPHAGELLIPWLLAMKNKLPVTALSDLVFPYPTLSEVSKRAAVSYLTPKLRSPWLPRILKFMRLFG
jgi:pyruvate/2-oxoglutarate dehydrogenase complex dihydrolipoamide dehydrogenase (E3) component